jgi:outer membrane lipoprotein
MRCPVLAIATAVIALGGCATVPPQLAGSDFVALTPLQAVQQNARGERVRWGGKIVKVEPQSEQTCFEILSRELFADARPRPRDASGGRFIACSKGFYDPELYTRGRDLTVTGRLAGTEQHKVGGYDYTYARVEADAVYLWPKRERRDVYYGTWPYYDPFWGPWGPYWGTMWWTPPVVIMHGNPPHR